MMIVKASTPPTTLNATLDVVWAMLLRGSEKASDPFHCPVLGTAGATNVNLRTVVLRRVMVADRILVCHTDRRSRKVADIAKHPGVEWLFYHPKAKIQLRISGVATVHVQDELAERQWAASKLISRRCYCAVDPPGTVISQAWSGLPETLVNRTPTATESENGYQHFAVITCQVTDIDWLYLQSSGHLRARFSWGTDGLHATWLTP